MQKDTTDVGLDTHKDSISVAMLSPTEARLVEWQVAHEEAAVRKMVKKIRAEAPGRVVCCYEAGPCGYALQRQMQALGVECQVIAPSLIPVKLGDRIKTNRRDARKLAELLRAGLLTEVHPPTAADEAVRDLCRAREYSVEDRVRCRHRIAHPSPWVESRVLWATFKEGGHARTELYRHLLGIELQSTDARAAASDRVETFTATNSPGRSLSSARQTSPKPPSPSLSTRT